jgi:hypothetical protein
LEPGRLLASEERRVFQNSISTVFTLLNSFRVSFIAGERDQAARIASRYREQNGCDV